MNHLETYLTQLREARATGEAVKETSFYPAISALLNGKAHLLEGYALANDEKEFWATSPGKLAKEHEERFWFEILLAPFVVAHLQLSLMLQSAIAYISFKSITVLD